MKNKVSFIQIFNNNLIWICVLCLLAVGMAVFVSVNIELFFLTIGLLLLAGVIFLYPELGLVAFLFAGQVKNVVRISDPDSVITTAIVIGITISSVLLLIFRRKLLLGRPINLGLNYVCLLLFCFYLLISAWFFGDHNWSIEKALRFTLFANFFILGTAWMSQEIHRIRRVLIVIVGASLLLSSAGILFPNYFGEGLATFSYHYIDFGRAVGIGVIIATVIVLLHPNLYNYQKILLLGTILIGWIAIIASNSRGNFLSILICTNIIIIRLIIHKREKLFTFVILMILIFVIYVAFSLEGNLLNSFGENRFVYLVSDINLDRSLSNRILAISTAYDQFLSSPIIGIGVGNYKLQIPGYLGLYLNYPHNILIELLSETGIIGMLLMIIPVISALLIGWQFYREPLVYWNIDWIFMAIFAGLLFNLIGAFVSGDVQVNRNIWLFVGLSWVSVTLKQ